MKRAIKIKGEKGSRQEKYLGTEKLGGFLEKKKHESQLRNNSAPLCGRIQRIEEVSMDRSKRFTVKDRLFFEGKT